MKDIVDRVWPLVIVGRGSSAAYYVSSLRLKDYACILAIGDDDPWAGKRGHSGNASDPTLKINHPLHLIQHFKDTVPGFSDVLVDRLDWAAMNASTLLACDVRILNAKVKLISESDFPDNVRVDSELGRVSGYQVELASGEKIYAYKVVMAGGAGGHRVPDELKLARQQWPKKILDLDEFASLPVSALQAATQVIAIGPNATIDAIHKSLNYKCKISWLIAAGRDGKKPDPPALKTQPRVLAAKAAPDANNLAMLYYKSFLVLGQTGMRLGIQAVPLDPKDHEGRNWFRVEGDYIVYGLGQTGEPVEAISSGIKEKLKPLFDKSQCLGGGADTILAYEAEGTGLKRGFEAVGAISAQIGRELNNRAKNVADQISHARSIAGIRFAITNGGFPVKPFLMKDPAVLAKYPRNLVHAQLKAESQAVVAKSPGVRDALEQLCNLILAYHTAVHFDNLYDSKNFQKLLNNACANLPKGTVADSGQLTTIRAAIGAIATMRGVLPKYSPRQVVPVTRSGKTLWDKVQTKPGTADFNADNANVLQIFICATFPCIPPDKANAFMDEVMQAMHNSDIGFTEDQVRAYKKRLDEMNTAALVAELKKH